MVSVRKVSDRVAMIHNGKIYFDGKFDDFINQDDQVIQDFIKRTGY